MDASITQLFNLDGQVALVTGGAKGIGQGVAEILAAAGARIALADTDAETAAATATALNAQGRTALAVGADTSDESLSQKYAGRGHGRVPAYRYSGQ